MLRCSTKSTPSVTSSGSATFRRHATILPHSRRAFRLRMSTLFFPSTMIAAPATQRSGTGSGCFTQFPSWFLGKLSFERGRTFPGEFTHPCTLDLSWMTTLLKLTTCGRISMSKSSNFYFSLSSRFPFVLHLTILILSPTLLLGTRN